MQEDDASARIVLYHCDAAEQIDVNGKATESSDYIYGKDDYKHDDYGHNDYAYKHSDYEDKDYGYDHDDYECKGYGYMSCNGDCGHDKLLELWLRYPDYYSVATTMEMITATGLLLIVLNNPRYCYHYNYDYPYGGFGYKSAKSSRVCDCAIDTTKVEKEVKSAAKLKEEAKSDHQGKR
eukprot:jgi/Phyca11/533316/estExt2_fgenesh1_pg.C_PHYCAscaffold_120123